jgi:hypothetical protein
MKPGETEGRAIGVSGLYSRNKLFDVSYLTGKEDLPALENEVYSDESIVSSVEDDYEIAIEEDWPNFIKNLHE